ncbi:MAG TPA: hypothetical protein VK855_07315 [Thioalkalivibrio sp.]|nr:hypothetical protein [Thioalkalivibrio sp.]
MRLVLVLLALFIVGLLIHQQMGRRALAPETVTDPGADVPTIPRQAGEIPGFEVDLNRYVDTTAEKRRQQMEESLERQ